MRNSKLIFALLTFCLFLGCPDNKSNWETKIETKEQKSKRYRDKGEQMWNTMLLIYSFRLGHGACEAEYKAKANFFPEVGKEYTREFSQGLETNFLFVRSSNLLITFTILNNECRFYQFESIQCNSLWDSGSNLKETISPLPPSGKNYYTINESPIKNTITLNEETITSIYFSYYNYPPTAKCIIKFKVEYQ